MLCSKSENKMSSIISVLRHLACFNFGTITIQISCEIPGTFNFMLSAFSHKIPL